MRDGRNVPQLRPADCIDLMVGVLQNMRLHASAAEGYVKTGLRAPLDDAPEDAHIVREAGAFWRQMGVRAKMTSAVAEVRAEHRANRWQCTVADVKRLIRPCQRSRKVDAILQRLGDDSGDSADEREGSEASEPSQDPLGDWAASGDEMEAADAETGRTTAAVAADETMPIAEEVAEAVAQSSRVLAVYESVKEELSKTGCVRLAHAVDAEINRESRRMRELGKQDPRLLRALAQRREAEHAEERKRLRILDETNAREASLQSMRQRCAEASQQLRGKKSKP